MLEQVERALRARWFEYGMGKLATSLNPHGVRVPPLFTGILWRAIPACGVMQEEYPAQYPRRLYHTVPGWVSDGALFHIRLRARPENPEKLTDSKVASMLLAAARNYHERQRWFCSLFLVMPDHLHAMLSFPPHPGMSRTIGEWKKFTARTAGVLWQSNYFDHRLRHERESAETYEYILGNPAAKNLLLPEQTWPWMWSGAAM